MNKYLWNFFWDCGRSGSVSGLFVATEKEVEEAINQHVYFGEILGKHSEVYGTIDEGDITKVKVSSEAVEEIATILGANWSGYNPLDYVEVTCPRCEDSVRKDELWLIDGELICGGCVTDEETTKALRGDYE